MAGKIPGRLPRKEDLETIKQMDQYLGDIGTKLSRLAAGSFPTFQKAVDSFISANSKARDLQKQLGKMSKEQKKLNDAQQAALEKVMKTEAKYAVAGNKAREKIQEKLEKQRATLDEITESSENVKKSIESTQKAVGKLSTGFSSLSKVVGVALVNSLESVLRSVAKIGIDMLSFSFKKLEEGVQRVYELFERWTKALGAFNMQLGGISPNIDTAIKQGKKW